VKIE